MKETIIQVTMGTPSEIENRIGHSVCVCLRDQEVRWFLDLEQRDKFYERVMNPMLLSAIYSHFNIDSKKLRESMESMQPLDLSEVKSK
jgi:hypothetical protein